MPVSSSTPVSEVKTGEVVLAQYPNRIVTYGVGSCIVVCMFVKQYRTAVMGHFMLPTAPAGSTNKARYVDTGLDLMLNMLLDKGVDKSSITLSVFGGAHMFKVLEDKSLNIGKRNINALSSWLSDNDISPVVSDLGGNKGRNITMELEEGFVFVEKSH